MMDLIDRQAAIDALTEYGNGRTVYIGVEEAIRRIEQLPPVQPVVKDINVSCKDAISRQDAIDAVDKLSDKPIGYLESAIDVLVDLPSVQPESHWIQCSDKIPSEAQECWITAKDGTVCQGMFTRQYGERRDSGFICNNGFAWLNTVVAWMPYDMPEPYQKEGE